MEKTKQQIVDRLKQANNVLVTVRRDPSIDQLAACIGLSLALNKLDKHATAVYSGATPSTIEFLKPEDTIEKNTDSLRDFIISLDKSKADKLRYKVEDQVVRIFITPYRTSISDADLDFSQGDFNVDVVLALGVHEQRDLDQAITAHGRILHDATVVTINNEGTAELGAINLSDNGASSLSELAAGLAIALGEDVLDEQISTALLTGIVSETDRFSNEKTSAETMKISSSLMAAGANQQLVAAELEEEAEPVGESDNEDDDKGSDDQQIEGDARIKEDGTLEINHQDDQTKDSHEEEQANDEQPDVQPSTESEATAAPKEAEDTTATPAESVENVAYKNPRKMVSEPPAITNVHGTGLDGEHEPLTDPLTLPAVDGQQSAEGFAPQPVFNASMPAAEPVMPPAPTASAAPATPAPTPASVDPAKDTLADIERSVGSRHLTQQEASQGVEELNLADLQTPADLVSPAPPVDVDAARSAVEAAVADASGPTKDAPLAPIAALNAQPLGDSLHTSNNAPAPTPASTPVQPAPQQPVAPDAQPPAGPGPNNQTAEQPVTMPLPTPGPLPPPRPTVTTPQPNAAPPVPPPIMPFPGQ